jgi:hypothetical protein
MPRSADASHPSPLQRYLEIATEVALDNDLLFEDEAEPSPKVERASSSATEPKERSPQPRDTLRSIGLTVDKITELQGKLRRSVKAARNEGKSWNEIGKALGVTRQAARSRFGSRT